MKATACDCESVYSYIKRGKVSVRTFVTLGVASSGANDVIMRITSQ